MIKAVPSIKLLIVRHIASSVGRTLCIVVRSATISITMIRLITLICDQIINGSNFFKNFQPLWMFSIEDMHFADDQSWRILLIMLETKSIFIIMTLDDSEVLSCK